MSKITINVRNQTLRMIPGNIPIIAGSQEFVRFHFELDDDWDELTSFAQFTQGGTSYNQYLDSNNDVYLPAEIIAGTCTLMLYGSGSRNGRPVIIGTTNVLTLTIDENSYISDASSTEITESLYNQLVQKVNELLDLSNSDYSELIRSSITELLDDYLENGYLAEMTIGDGTIERIKVDTDFESTLDKADTAMQPSVYDPLNYHRDVFSYVIAQDTNTLQRLRGTNVDVSTGTQNFIVTDVAGNRYSYFGLDNALNDLLQRSENYAGGLLAEYSPFSIVIVDELPEAENAADRTFYLISKNGGYEKYWRIQDENEDYIWDSFGSSSTLVLSELPEVGAEDIDYIVGSDGDYQYYKYINGEWNLIAGNNAAFHFASPAYMACGTDLPGVLYDASEYDGEYYLYTPTMVPYLSENDSWVAQAAVFPSPSTSKDYFIGSITGISWLLHFRYIDNLFSQVGSSSYTMSEIDSRFASMNASIERVEDIVEDIAEEIPQTIADALEVTEAELDAAVSELRSATDDLAAYVREMSPVATAYGPIVSVDDAAPLNAENVTVKIEPVQAGSGDPSPTNIRPISGWTGVNVYREAEYDTEAEPAIEIAFPASAGTVYGGTVDVKRGKLIVEYTKYKLKAFSWTYTNSRFRANDHFTKAQNATDGLCNVYPNAGGGRTTYIYYKSYYWDSNSRIYVQDNRFDNVTDFRNFLTESDAEVVSRFGNPVEYDLTPVEIDLLRGANNLWADTGDTALTYRRDVATLLNAIDDTVVMRSIAPVEDGATASQAYAQGAYFFRNGDFCKAKTGIASGAAFTLDTNYQVTTVATELFTAINS